MVCMNVQMLTQRKQNIAEAIKRNKVILVWIDEKDIIKRCKNANI